MESKRILINNYDIICYNINTLVIGSGAAALNAAISLNSFRISDVVIATALWGGGTSNNAGSDKQTYYKLSLSGKEPDSVIEMAMDLFNGKCMHGDIALCEAQGSVRSFMRLVELGVGFPHDKYGSFAGYKTDHDPRSRATSAGPYTSKRMFEALASEVEKRKIKVLDNHACIALLTDQSGSRIIGAVAINTLEKEYKKAFVLFNAVNVILATGGPAGIYETSVYPHSQTGSTGMAFMAGAAGQNLTESQFGIASLKFRWNLSGSYQQALPRYFSTDVNGKDEREFLNDHFPDLRTLTKAIFLKGYQWPFDPRKIDGYGSSLIDILVDSEINEKHRKVYIDYTRNPSGKGNQTFSLSNLDPLVADYLRNCGALKENPFERLKAINSPAIDLYKDHGIDLLNEYLQIAVCAQHNNGGLKGNIWWESDLRHLFPVGEVNGSHGVYRPGGAALNSGQVGAHRAALFISRMYKDSPQGTEDFVSAAMERLTGILELSEKWMSTGGDRDIEKYFSEIRSRMSASGGIIRNPDKTKEAARQAHGMIENLPQKIGAGNVTGLAECYRLMDHCITHLIYLEAINFYIMNGGRSRGSYIVADAARSGSRFDPELCRFDREIENKIIEVCYREGKVSLTHEEVREVPEQDLWFEKVWKEYLEDIYPGC